jgi:acyl-CoA synthetase (AMP-forming)/AMP-acid ligase II
VINRYEGVKESLVYAFKHDQYGELPAAKIVLQNNCKIDIDDVRKFCYKHLAKYKVPKAFEFVSYLEKTSSGKLKRWFSIF